MVSVTWLGPLDVDTAPVREVKVVRPVGPALEVVAPDSGVEVGGTSSDDVEGT